MFTYTYVSRVLLLQYIFRKLDNYLIKIHFKPFKNIAPGLFLARKMFNTVWEFNGTHTNAQVVMIETGKSVYAASIIQGFRQGILFWSFA